MRYMKLFSVGLAVTTRDIEPQISRRRRPTPLIDMRDNSWLNHIMQQENARDP
jgi:hypothetical protein